MNESMENGSAAGGGGGIEGSETLEGFRKRAGSLKRKNSSSPSAGPSKRLAKDKSPLPPLHNGPIKTRHSPGKMGFNQHKVVGSNPLPSRSVSTSPHKGEDSPGNPSPQPAVPSSATDSKQEGVDQGDSPALSVELSAEVLKDQNAHVVPTPAGWFSWTKIHALEKRALPTFFNGKSKSRTPELYLEVRNSIMEHYHKNPQKQIGLTDFSDLVSEDLDARREIMEFLDHWGLINFRPFLSSSKDDPVVEEVQNPSTVSGNVEVDEEAATGALLLEKLYHFETVDAHSRVKPSGVSASQAPPAPVLAETAVSDVLVSSEGPAVEYHCNSCSADCSRRRYHCQKQADFDLCSDCYNAEKFGSGMVSTDFILMEPVTQATGDSGGSWTDQETLLLLEALELYGDNWNEIAEHVATKSKAQCILHFIRLPIEDPFLEDKEMPGTNTHGSLESGQGNKDSSSAVQSASESPVAKSSSSEEQPGGSKNDSAKLKEVEVANSAQKKVENDAIKAIAAAFQAVGALSGSQESLSFAEAGNPVMALVAFVAAMVAPDVASRSAQGALKAIYKEGPAMQLAARNCFLLDDPPNDSRNGPANVRVLDAINRAVVQKPEAQSSPLKENEGSEEDASKRTDGLAASEGSKGTEDLVPMVPLQESQVTAVGTSSATTSGENTGKIDPEQTTSPDDRKCSEGVVEMDDSHSLNRMKHAAVTALSAAAVKAKLLANQEEEHIQQLVAEVIDNQLKKLEIKVRHFRELEMALTKEREQIDRARQRLLTERAFIVRSGFSVTPPRSSSLPTVISKPPVPTMGRLSPAGGSILVTSSNTMVTKSPVLTSPKTHVRKVISTSVPKSAESSSSASPLNPAPLNPASGSSTQTVPPRDALPSVGANQGSEFK